MKTLSKPGTKAEISRRLQTLRADTPRRWGKMTVNQMICHLTDSFRAALGEKQSSMLPPRRWLMWLALYVPIPWPHGVPTRPEMSQEIGGTKPVEFQNDLQQLLLYMDRFFATPGDTVFSPHPMFGPMSRKERMRWAYLHMDHHLRQFGA